jgi:hypothetical protein
MSLTNGSDEAAERESAQQSREKKAREQSQPSNLYPEQYTPTRNIKRIQAALDTFSSDGIGLS